MRGAAERLGSLHENEPMCKKAGGGMMPLMHARMSLTRE